MGFSLQCGAFFSTRVTETVDHLAGVLPVHGVDGWSRVHVHEVVVGVAHHPPAPVMELHSYTYST
jgi:hypothetical protein